MTFTRFISGMIFLLVSAGAFSQSPDSLHKELDNASLQDTVRARLLLDLSEAYMKRGAMDSMLHWSHQAQDAAHRIPMPELEARALYMRGKGYAWGNAYPLAADDFLRAQAMYRQLGDDDGVADCYLQTGVLMFAQKNFQAALENFREAQPLFRKTGNKTRDAVNRYLTGLSYSELGRHKEALKALQEALQFQKSLGDEWKQMECQVAIANVYYETGRYEEALELFRSMLLYVDSLGSADGQSMCHVGIGKILAAQQKDVEAEWHLLKAYEISSSGDNDWVITRVIEPLYQFYERKGDYKKAYEFQKLFLQYRDSIFTEQNMQAMARIRSSLDLTRKQAEIDSLNKDEKFQAKIRWFLILITALLVAVLAGLYRRFLYKQKLNKALAQKNHELDMTLRHLKTAEQQLIKAEKMAVFGKLSAGIAHEIRNPLNFITNFSDLSLQAADDFIKSNDDSERTESASQLKKLLDKIGYHGRRADSIVTRMLQHSRSAHTEMEMTDISRLADEFSDLAYESMRNLITNFECRLVKKLDPDLPRVWLVPQDMSRVIINLLNNAFYAVNEKKHGHMIGYEPTVTVTTETKNGRVVLSIADNGGGIPASSREKIFEPFFTTKPMGEGTGLGLAICADIVKAAHGEISVHSNVETGTEFTVSFPLPVPLQAVSS